jgi:hypothetical protein
VPVRGLLTIANRSRAAPLFARGDGYYGRATGRPRTNDGQVVAAEGDSRQRGFEVQGRIDLELVRTASVGKDPLERLQPAYVDGLGRPSKTPAAEQFERVTSAYVGGAS